jgi:DNA-binding CsgD family transcriptional regulator
MTTLKLADVQKMQHFLQELHTFCNLETLATKVISTLSEVVASDLVVWSPANFSRHRILPAITKKLDSPMMEEIERTACQHFYEHPLARHYVETHDARAYKISDFLSRAELHQLESLYHGFLRLVDAEEQMIVVLPIASTNISLQNVTDPATDIVIALHRPKQNFTERDRLVLNLLRPHLLQAYKNAHVFSQMQHELAQWHEMKERWGIVTLSIDGNVQTMPPKAWEMLTHYFQDVWTRDFHLPELLQHWVHYQISLFNRDDMPPLHLPLQIEREKTCLIVRLICDRPQEQYFLMLEEQPSNQFSPKSLEMLGLTKREAEVLFLSTKDKSTKEIAAILRCREKTVEKHFEHIYAKLDVQSRMAATMKALNYLGLIKRPNYTY